LSESIRVPTLALVRSPDEVIDAVRKALAVEPHLRWGYVFGSVARKVPYRDVDVAVMPAATMPAGAVAWGQIIARLEAAIGRKVDLVDLTQPNLPLVGPLLTERVVVLDHEAQARRTWEAETTSRWLDFKPSWEEANRIRRLAMQRRLRGDP
jgi:predicted nucleotidyltransferase